MKTKLSFNCLLTLGSVIFLILLTQCNNQSGKMSDENSYKIIFLRHSTGGVIWKGESGFLDKIKHKLGADFAVPLWFNEYNETNGTNYNIAEQSFPKDKPYGWQNYPFDYYNIWVKNAGDKPYKEEATLEILTQEYDFIIFRHCFPVSRIEEDNGNPNIDSREKRIENYKLQYIALKEKMLQFPETKFLLWTGAALVESKTNEAQAKLTKEFFNWVRNDWDTENDNIFLWDFYELETEGGLYLKEEYAVNSGNPHPNGKFAARVAPLFCQRIVDIIETKGEKTTLTGVKK